ncbi:tripartite tricarboxylate transporter substrate binding protein [Siccirubricoccus sp. KC 17139]|uniref:Tripartite tricarboxylate transporter substrate binding protein n=1 Tax=Siccirubricoccus soli TaxID=2899147 RepID=A0ABT1D8K3_9PROT|nr:tripartite tricarboxylate transporter substrate binding protein [Siccirubricoccus soli]MCO6418267.1 tripartite tricarboxylate transporter substrate binding protein [Siccirubricoccus soli]MCP2684402.1 tripartite tricarboxylate transporter substrate binding protein [Siccirubricoccus soli]
MRMDRRRLVQAGLGLSGLGLARGARAQPGWAPERPLRWIVPAPPGGGFDLIARLLAQGLSPRLGQPIVIDNRPGAGTGIGAEAVAKAAPDGLTFGSADNGTLVYNSVLYRRLAYDPEKDFRVVGTTARFHLVLAARAGSAIGSAAALVAQAKGAAEPMQYGSPGAGLPHHLAMERLARETGAKLTPVHYRGLAPMMTDMLAGTIEVAVVDLFAGREHLSAGRFRPLAVCSETRLPQLPGVPTVAEALGLAGFEAYAWQALILPRATPDAPVLRLRQELVAVLQDRGVAAAMREQGLDPLPGGEAEFAARLWREKTVWVPLIQSLGITLD